MATDEKDTITAKESAVQPKKNSVEESLEDYVRACCEDKTIAVTRKFYYRPFDTFKGKFGDHGAKILKEYADVKDLSTLTQMDFTQKEHRNIVAFYKDLQSLEKDLTSANLIIQQHKTNIPLEFQQSFDKDFKQGYFFGVINKPFIEMQKKLGKKAAAEFQKQAQLMSIAYLNSANRQECVDLVSKRIASENKVINDVVDRYMAAYDKNTSLEVNLTLAEKGKIFFLPGEKDIRKDKAYGAIAKAAKSQIDFLVLTKDFKFQLDETSRYKAKGGILGDVKTAKAKNDRAQILYENFHALFEALPKNINEIKQQDLDKIKQALTAVSEVMKNLKTEEQASSPEAKAIYKDKFKVRMDGLEGIEQRIKQLVGSIENEITPKVAPPAAKQRVTAAFDIKQEPSDGPQHSPRSFKAG